MSLLALGEQLSQALARWQAEPSGGPEDVLELLKRREKAIAGMCPEQFSAQQRRELLEQDRRITAELLAARRVVGGRVRGQAFASQSRGSALFVDRST